MWKMARGAPSCRSIPLLNMLTTTPMPPAEQPILQVRDLVRVFGGIVAVNDFSLDVYPGTIHGLIGPNGAGKTTTFNVISGFYAPSSGKVIYLGEDISGRETSALAELGLIRTFQGTTLFHQLSVLDNVRLGCHRSAKAGLLSRILGSDRATEEAADGRRATSFGSSACRIWRTNSPPTCPMVISARSAWPWRSPPTRS